VLFFEVTQDKTQQAKQDNTSTNRSKKFILTDRSRQFILISLKKKFLFPLIFEIRTTNQGCKSWGVTGAATLWSWGGRPPPLCPSLYRWIPKCWTTSLRIRPQHKNLPCSRETYPRWESHLRWDSPLPCGGVAGPLWWSPPWTPPSRVGRPSGTPPSLVIPSGFF
jgi:hypothetical protein